MALALSGGLSSPAGARDLFKDGVSGAHHFSTTKKLTPETAESDFVRYTLNCEKLDPRTMRSYVEQGGDYDGFRRSKVQRCRISWVSLAAVPSFLGQRIGDEADLTAENLRKIRKEYPSVEEARKKMKAEPPRSPLQAKQQEQFIGFAALLESEKYDEAVAYIRKNQYSKCEVTVFNGSDFTVFRQKDADTWHSDKSDVSCGDVGKVRGTRQRFLRRAKGDWFDFYERECGKPERLLGAGQESFTEKAGITCDTMMW
jgi:hypothetical protein